MFLLFISCPRVVLSAKQEIARVAPGAARAPQDRSQIADGRGRRRVLRGLGEKLMAGCRREADA